MVNSSSVASGLFTRRRLRRPLKERKKKSMPRKFHPENPPRSGYIIVPPITNKRMGRRKRSQPRNWARVLSIQTPRLPAMSKKERKRRAPIAKRKMMAMPRLVSGFRSMRDSSSCSRECRFLRRAIETNCHPEGAKRPKDLREILRLRLRMTKIFYREKRGLTKARFCDILFRSQLKPRGERLCVISVGKAQFSRDFLSLFMQTGLFWWLGLARTADLSVCRCGTDPPMCGFEVRLRRRAFRWEVALGHPKFVRGEAPPPARGGGGGGGGARGGGRARR